MFSSDAKALEIGIIIPGFICVPLERLFIVIPVMFCSGSKHVALIFRDQPAILPSIKIPILVVTVKFTCIEGIVVLRGSVNWYVCVGVMMGVV